MTAEEKKELITNCDRLSSLKHSPSLPYTFTEQGVAMLSSVLKSKRAIHVNILIMQTFVRLRELVSSHKEILKKIEDMENKYDAQFKRVFDAIKALINPSVKETKKIGFIVS